jgi:hypothetical protein
VVTNESRNARAASDTWSTARVNASSLAFDGLVSPDSLRTNCRAEARISSAVAVGRKVVQRLDAPTHTRLLELADQPL